MIANKHITVIIAVIAAAAVAICLGAAAFADIQPSGVTMEYESRLFDTDEIISINILMDESSWNEMLENAIDENYYKCDVVVNGTTVKNVGIRTKGNTSLSSIVSDPDSDRYSLKLEFDCYEKGQTCFGLDKLVLNNNFADATNMKEAIVYDMFQYLGADASLYNYANVEVNGEYWGVYLALEAVEDSFLLRTNSTSRGELYKPDSMEIGGGDDDKGSGKKNMPDMGNNPDSSESSDENTGSEPSQGFSPGNMPQMPQGGGSFPGGGGFPGGGNMPDFGGDMPQMPDSESLDFEGGMPDMSDFDFSGFGGNMPERPESDSSDSGTDSSDSKGGMPGSNPSDFGGKMFSGSGGANLNYTDDDPDSYSAIWDGAMSKISDKDKTQVITALRNISEGNDLEEYLDVDNVLRYMAVHTFAVNLDSLSGNMAHNYYLYESGGKLNIIPWDYNLSFGGMTGGSDASGTVNFAIDTPFQSTNFFDALLENEEYLAKYHEYLRILVDEYVNGGIFEESYSRIRSQIDALVETDPNAFYTYEEYEAGAEMLYNVIKLRAESVEGQLDGTIPSTRSGQSADSSSLVDASDIDISVMGTFMSGGGNMGGRFFPGGRGNTENVESGSDSEPPASPSDAGAESVGDTPQGSESSSGSRPSAPSGDGQQFSPGGFSPRSNGSASNIPGIRQSSTSNLISIGIGIAVLIAALAAAVLFRRKRIK
ncbi:MAG: CotH kinase family protein [Oscillospiraceae bacterium]|nr:CotH kinase family protein [Oscillospiraceae bacterium]